MNNKNISLNNLVKASQEKLTRLALTPLVFGISLCFMQNTALAGDDGIVGPTMIQYDHNAKNLKSTVSPGTQRSLQQNQLIRQAPAATAPYTKPKNGSTISPTSSNKKSSASTKNSNPYAPKAGNYPTTNRQSGISKNPSFNTGRNQQGINERSRQIQGAQQMHDAQQMRGPQQMKNMQGTQRGTMPGGGRDPMQSGGKQSTQPGFGRGPGMGTGQGYGGPYGGRTRPGKATPDYGPQGYSNNGRPGTSGRGPGMGTGQGYGGPYGGRTSPGKAGPGYGAPGSGSSGQPGMSGGQGGSSGGSGFNPGDPMGRNGGQMGGGKPSGSPFTFDSSKVGPQPAPTAAGTLGAPSNPGHAGKSTKIKKQLPPKKPAPPKKAPPPKPKTKTGNAAETRSFGGGRSGTSPIDPTGGITGTSPIDPMGGAPEQMNQMEGR